MNETLTALLIIGIVIVALAGYFIYCLNRNRREWIDRLKPGDMVKYGNDERIGVIVALYLNNVAIQDCSDLNLRKVAYSDIKHL